MTDEEKNFADAYDAYIARKQVSDMQKMAKEIVAFLSDGNFHYKEVESCRKLISLITQLETKANIMLLALKTEEKKRN